MNRYLEIFRVNFTFNSIVVLMFRRFRVEDGARGAGMRARMDSGACVSASGAAASGMGAGMNSGAGVSASGACDCDGGGSVSINAVGDGQSNKGGRSESGEKEEVITSGVIAIS